MDYGTLIKTGFFRSVDLYGDERVGATADYAPFFRLAGELGLRRKAHAGELCPASSVRAGPVTPCHPQSYSDPPYDNWQEDLLFKSFVRRARLHWNRAGNRSVICGL